MDGCVMVQYRGPLHVEPAPEVDGYAHAVHILIPEAYIGIRMANHIVEAMQTSSVHRTLLPRDWSDIYVYGLALDSKQCRCVVGWQRGLIAHADDGAVSVSFDEPFRLGAVPGRVRVTRAWARVVRSERKDDQAAREWTSTRLSGQLPTGETVPLLESGYPTESERLLWWPVLMRLWSGRVVTDGGVRYGAVCEPIPGAQLQLTCRVPAELAI